VKPGPAIVQCSATVTARARIGEQHHRLRLRAPRVARAALPGQFVHVRAMDHGTLRRPISVHRVPSKTEIELLFKVVGEGTALLTAVRPGETVDVLGPTGTGFHMGAKVKTAVLVGGGVGAAPLVYLADRLERRAARVLFFLGAASRDALPLAVEETREGAPFLPAARPPYLRVPGLETRGARSVVVLEQTRTGYRGLVTDVLARALGRLPRDGLALFACGPKPMAAAVAHLAARRKVPCQVSLEQRMGCGIGACVGCAVPVKTKRGTVYRRACIEGPVFAAEDLDWSAPW
jgi:dihydroorotate dehydrogenase electron transfer subunit